MTVLSYQATNLANGYMKISSKIYSGASYDLGYTEFSPRSLFILLLYVDLEVLGWIRE